MSTDKVLRHQHDFTFTAPFTLVLADDEVFYAEKVVRVIPKKRLVVFGYWQGKAVVAKIFFNARHRKKDRLGVKALQDNHIPTPELYYDGMSKDKRCYVLLFRRLLAAKSLKELWLEKRVELTQLQAVMIELATQHVLGILQHDLHLDNFLLTDKIIYTLDGAQIERFVQPLPKKSSMQSVALFLSQLGAGVDDLQETLFCYYAKSRGWPINSKDKRKLFLLIRYWNKQRWFRYEQKIFRSSTDFAPIRRLNMVGMYNRHYAMPEFMQFMHNPEAVYHHASVKLLKLGRSSTVAKVTLDKRDYVIKRYNTKNIFHYFRRCLRATRAECAWRLAEKLKLFHIPTAIPVAYLEERFLGLRGRSYFVTEYIPGMHIGEFLDHHQQDEAKLSTMAITVTRLLKTLMQFGITHGDLKASNILITASEHPRLIDLDGAKEHTSRHGLRTAWRKEIKRFLHNFAERPALLTRFKQELDLLKDQI